MMKLYTYWRSLATFRVRIALNLKGIAYEPVYVDLDAGQQNQAGFKNVNPQMVIPALVEDDGNVLFQSLAIYDQAAKEGWGKRDGAALPAYWPQRTAQGGGNRS